jgi:CARDB
MRRIVVVLALACVGLAVAAAAFVALGKAPKARLRVTFVRPSASSVTAGGTLGVRYAVRNTGHGKAPRSVVRLYLNGRARVAIARRVLPRIGAGHHAAVRTAVRVRTSVAAGNYRLQACVSVHRATRCRTAPRAILVLRPGQAPGGQNPPSGQTSGWRPRAGFAPLSDTEAAAHVQPAPETRPDNTAANHYIPSTDELHAFYSARNDEGQTAPQRNPYLADVTGGYAGTTDEIIQWAAWKWGIPADWLRAQYVVESYWHQSTRGDLNDVGLGAVGDYPPQSRQTDSGGQYTGRVWQSLGISQITWKPDGSAAAGTEPLRWKSTAFAADYQAAVVRWYYDDPRGTRSAWGDSSYRPGDPWLSIGGWFNPYPWNNSSQRGYIAQVQKELANRTWAQPDF